MTKEKILTKKVQLIAGQNGITCFDVNVGKFQLKNGGFVNVGLPAGFPDLLLLTPDGRVIFIEAKIKPNKPQPAQIKFLNFLRANNHSAHVIYSVDDFLNLLNTGFKVDKTILF